MELPLFPLADEEEDTRLLLKTLPYRPSTVTGMTGEVATNAIFQLLNSLGKKYPSYRDYCTSPVANTPTNSTPATTSTPLQNLAVAPVPVPMPAPVYRACAGNPLNPDEITEGVRVRIFSGLLMTRVAGRFDPACRCWVMMTLHQTVKDLNI